MNVESNAITRFRGDYFFLSNFFPCGILFDGLDYPTLEHAYQASKTTVQELRCQIRDAKTPGTAKRMGSALAARPGFYTDGIALNVMEGLVTQKFVRHKPLRALLLETGNRQLVEGYTGSRTWGAVHTEQGWEGDNHLGIILMLVRERIRRGVLAPFE
jgi:ribA/ribD-fused uncharacterized protein